MCAEHDNLIRFIGSGNLSDDVEGIEVIRIELVFDIHLDSHGNLFFEHSPDSAVVFDRHPHLRGNRRIRDVSAATTLNENRAFAASAGFDRRDYPLVGEKLEAAVIEIGRIVSTARAGSASLSGATATRRLY